MITTPGEESKRMTLLSTPMRIVIVLLVLGCLVQSTARGAHYKLIICSGQSNMVGYDTEVADLPADAVDANIPFFYGSNTAWSTLQTQVADGVVRFRLASGGFGPEMSLARDLYSGGMTNLAVFKYAITGTSFWEGEWTKAGDLWYPRMFAAYTNAVALLEDDGANTVELAGFFWLQGEGDSQQAPPSYYNNFTQFISDIRTDYSAPNLWVYCGVKTDFHANTPANVVAPMQQIASEDDYVAYVDTYGAATYSGFHFSSAGTLTVGSRYATAYLNDNPIPTPPTAVDDAADLRVGNAEVIELLANDSGHDLVIESVDATATNAAGLSLGSVSHTPGESTVTFTSTNTMFGDAFFSYVVTNSLGTDTGMVTITVSPEPQVTVLAHYAFDGNFNDTSGNGNHSAAQGASVSINTTTNVFGSGCADFTATREWVTIPLQSFAIGEPFTLSFWARPTGDRESMVMGEAGTQDSLVWLKHNSSELRFFNDAGANYNFSDLPGINSWNHYVLVAGDLDGDGDALDLCAYINNVKKTAINDIQTHMKINAIGDAYNSSSWDFKGQIDEVWIFSGALDATAVDYLYTYNEAPMAGAIFTITDDDAAHDEAVQDVHAIFESEAQHGSRVDFSVGEAGSAGLDRAAVMRFDVSDLAGINDVGAITLRLKVKTIESGTTADIVIKRLLESVGDWVEDDVTRSIRVAGTNWLGSGTSPIQNADNVGEELARYGDDAGETFSAGAWIEIPLVPPTGSLDDLIADWNTGNNEGIRLEPDSYSNKRVIFHSSEATNLSERPQLVVTIQGNDPIVNAFQVDQPRVLDGQSVMLSWSATNATALSIDHGVGDVLALTTNGLGSISVTPTNTTTYTLTATNPEGLISAEARVRVVGPDQRPNIILFYVDDMGWQDTSVEFHTAQTIYNRRYITPSMERLADRGMVFTQGYSPATICAPSRYGIMTGQLPAKSHWTYNGDGQPTATILPPVTDPEPITTANTVPRELGTLGYHTIQVGKWHLSDEAGIYSAGFDEKIAGFNKGMPGSYYGAANFGSGDFHVPDLAAYHGQDIFLSEAITLEANKAIGRAVTNAEPFFLFMSHYAVHTPIQNDSRFNGNYNDAGDGDHYIANATERAYATLVEGMDKSLGDMMDHLEALGVAEDTLIVFSSDHGGLSTSPRGPSAYPGSRTHNWPLRNGKGWTYEGGVRVPFIASWATNAPANPIQASVPIAAGSEESRPVSQLDLLPTFVALAGGEIPVEADGHDISGYLTNSPTASRPETFLWHQPHYRPDHDVPHSTAMRQGDHKLIYWYESGAWALYDLANDLSETNDLSATETNLLQQLITQMTNTLEAVGAQYPTWVSTGEEIIPAPATPPPPTATTATDANFYLLGNTKDTSALGDVYHVQGSTGGKTIFSDFIPPFTTTGMFYWRGFATDGDFFYVLNTSAGNGTIDRVPLDGSTKTVIADIDPTLFGQVENWEGFAADNNYFYLLSTASSTLGDIARINKDGSGPKVTIIPGANNPVPGIASCKGFGCDGSYFYFLNTDGAEPAKGTIYRTNMDGAGLVTIRDLSPDLFGNLQWYDGFAVCAPKGTVLFVM